MARRDVNPGWPEARSCPKLKYMRTTRILLADKSGILCEAALRLRWMLPDLSPGACAVRSADSSEPLTQWHPDLVLLDPNLDETGAAPKPQTRTSLGASRVLVLSLSYEPEQSEQSVRAAPSRAAHPQKLETGHLASATVEAVEMRNPVLARYASRASPKRPAAPGESGVAQDV
jgi:hypothetical protein